MAGEAKILNRKLRLALLAFLVAAFCFHLTAAVAFAQVKKTSSLLSQLSLKANNVLKVSFTFSPKYPAEGQVVQFVESSSGSPTSWIWDFGDGTTGTERNPFHAYSKSGFRKVTLTIAKGTTSKRASRTLTVLPNSTEATFVFSPATPGPGQTVQFADTTSGNPASWRWDFGDGAASTVKNPGHAYTRAGSYIVTLTTNDGSTSKRGSQTISVASISVLTCSFSFSPAMPIVIHPIQFTDTSTGSPTSWLWNFGDGGTSTSQNPSHTYATAGEKTVTLTVTNASGSHSTSHTLSVSAALTASFTYNPSSPAVGQTVQFADTSVGSPTSWSWIFGDGAISTAQNPIHTYSTAGSKTVTLTVANSSGSNTATRTLTVTTALAASFIFSPASPTADQTVQFTDTSVGSPTSWSWSFGDGATSTAQNPSHTYTAAGLKTVTLTVANSTGSNTATRTVTVATALTASFTFSPASPTVGKAVQFTDTSAGSPTSWSWSFGDGTTSIVQNPSHTYATSGEKAVTLTVTNASGSHSMSHTLSVFAALGASFTYNPSSPAVGQTVQFADTSTGTPNTWQWDFGDGTTGYVKDPSHAYTSSGSFYVSLTVSDGVTAATTSKTVMVFPTLSASYTFSPQSPVGGEPVQFTDTSVGNPSTWVWNFGDTTSSTLKNPTHTFLIGGTYSVTLTVTNGTGSKTVTKAVNVADKLTASFTYSPSSPIIGQVVQFTDLSTGSPTSWSWDFGDGLKNSAKNPTHTYTQSGIYTVTLTVSNSSSSSNITKALSVSGSSTRTKYSVSCELADVKAAVAEANPGDTVVVPKGEARWNSQLVINKGIVLKTEIIGGTTITLPSTGTGWRQGAILYLDENQSNNDPFRLSGFVFDGGGVCPRFLELDTKSGSPVQNKVRVDHNVFQNGSSGGTRFMHKSGAIYMLFDNNTVYFYGSYDFISLYDSNVGYDAWASRPFHFGSADQNYFEDNVYYKNDNHMVYMTGYGARYCSRHNTYHFSMSSGNVYLYDVHGSMNDQTWSDIGFEAYDETAYCNGLDVNICDGRGGKGLMYNLYLQNAGSTNTRIREEYNDYLLDPAYQLQTGEPQYPNDWYLWNIYINDVKSLAYGITVGSTVYYDHLGRYVPQENQEYWREKSSFDGSSGIGVGPISQRPLSCSKEGVAWWATDENKLYRWHNGKWELCYVPYTYPHPLRAFVGD